MICKSETVVRIHRAQDKAGGSFYMGRVGVRQLAVNRSGRLPAESLSSDFCCRQFPV